MSRIITATALSIRQPWATAVIQPSDCPFKSVENRSWPTSYRGPLVIHAGAADFTEQEVKEMRRLGIDCPEELDCGALLGVVDLVDCIAADSRPGRELRARSVWANSPRYVSHYFVLANPRLLSDPIPYRGRLRLFKITEPTVLRRLAPLLDRQRWPEGRGADR